MPRSKPVSDPPAPDPTLPEIPPGPVVNMSVRIPVEVEIQLHGLARKLGCPKRLLVTRFLISGMDRYTEGRRLRAYASDLIGEGKSVA